VARGNALDPRFALGVTAMVLVLLRTTTWAGDGFWAPDGAYAQYIATIVMAIWVLGVTGVLLRRPSTARVTERAAVPVQ
jgi:hypothetical protein